MKKARRSTVDGELASLAEATRAPSSAEARAALGAALASRHAAVAARAAKTIKEHRLDGFDGALAAAFARFLDDPVKSDPGCRAKTAAIEALDYAESLDASPFLRAARVVQKEPAYGGPVDTASALRARAVLALARIGHADLGLVAAELLTDGESPVRAAACDALGHAGDRAGAGLALLKLRLGDADPMVTLAAAGALLALAPGWALGALRPLLLGADEDARELAAVALGQSRADGAVALLEEALAASVRAAERAPILRGLGLHRSDGALAALLAVIAGGARDDARAAVAALAPRRFEPAVVARARAAARDNPRADLDEALAQAFRDG